MLAKLKVELIPMLSHLYSYKSTIRLISSNYYCSTSVYLNLTLLDVNLVKCSKVYESLSHIF